MNDTLTRELEAQSAPLDALLLDAVRYVVLALACSDEGGDTFVGLA